MKHRVISRDGFIYVVPNYVPPEEVGLTTRHIRKFSDYIIDPEGRLLKNRYTGVLTPWKTSFNWRERFRIFFTGKI